MCYQKWDKHIRTLPEKYVITKLSGAVKNLKCELIRYLKTENFLINKVIFNSLVRFVYLVMIIGTRDHSLKLEK